VIAVVGYANRLVVVFGAVWTALVRHAIVACRNFVGWTSAQTVASVRQAG
jgi:hypothetical protein